jgi:serine/threonine-protein phosphatase 2B regulatory subunit
VSADDLAIMLRQLAGSSLTDDAISALVSRALAEAGGPAGSGLTLADFKAALPNGDLEGMRVTVPTEL